MTPDFDAFFGSYTDLYNRALSGNPDYESIMARFSSCFVAAGPTGVTCGAAGPDFRATLDKGYAFYRQIGAKSMRVQATHATEIDEIHFLVKVFYHAAYEKKSGDEVTVDFTVSYLIEAREEEPKIFAFIAGDEMALYKQHGLID